MTRMIIPLRSSRDDTSALAALDATAMEFLQEGRAATLSAARLDAIREELLTRRAQLAAVIADLHARPPSGDARIDAVNAVLSGEGSVGLTYIEASLEQVETCIDRLR